MATLSLDNAYLTAIWLETLFYGINFVLFWSTIFVFTYKRRLSNTNLVLVLLAISQYILSTAHVGLGFRRLIVGFIELRNQPGEPAAYFAKVSVPINVAKVYIHTLNTILGDSVVAWRCYLVWGRSWLAASLPIALIVGSTTCGFAQAVYFARASTNHSVFDTELVNWDGSLVCLSLATNLIGTGLISFRLWTMSRVYTGGSKYGQILALLIESASLYSLALIILLILYYQGSVAFYIVYDPIGQLTSIIPTMILLLVGLRLTISDTTSITRSNQKDPTVLSRFSFRPRDDTTPTATTSDFPMIDNHSSIGLEKRTSANDPDYDVINIDPASNSHSEYEDVGVSA